VAWSHWCRQDPLKGLPTPDPHWAQENVVLHVDLKKTDRELSRDIAERCSNLGVVRTVKIHREPSNFALVKMTTHAETVKLAGQYGESTFHNGVLVHLEQDNQVA